VTVKPSNVSTSKRRLVGPALAIVALALLLTLVQVSGLSVLEGFFTNLGIFLILVMALNLASGFTGVFSLGHIGFMALGAYGSAILTLPLSVKLEYLPNLPPWLAGAHFDFNLGPLPIGFLLATLIVAVLVSIVALLVGLVLMRLSGNFVAVATLGFLVIVRVVLINADTITRGSRTFSNVTAYTNLAWVWITAIVVVYAVWRLKRSPFGRAMLAQREDRWAAQAIGIEVMRPRLLAFVISAFFTAIAGSLYAHYITSFSPEVFYFDLTFRVVTMLVVGGLGSVSGAVIGTVLVVFLEDQLRRIADATLLYGLNQVILASIFLFIMIFRREGLLGQREIPLDRLFMKGGDAVLKRVSAADHVDQ
jgi:branched-chain amino acid transport system permease protein